MPPFSVLDAMAQNTATLERGVAQRSGESRNMSRPNPRNLSTDFQATTPNTVAKIMGTCCTQLQELVSTSEDEGGALDETMHCLVRSIDFDALSGRVTLVPVICFGIRAICGRDRGSVEGWGRFCREVGSGWRQQRGRTWLSGWCWLCARL